MNLATASLGEMVNAREDYLKNRTYAPQVLY
jgi:hypothetical protein